jgi:hypothetical protein
MGVQEAREFFESRGLPATTEAEEAVERIDEPSSAEGVGEAAVNDGNDVEVVLEFDDPDMKPITFELEEIPGAGDLGDDIEAEEGDIEVEEEEEVEVEEPEAWDWSSRGLAQFLPWLSGMMQGVPRHTGHDTTGLEKAIAYFELLDKEITKAMRQDFKNEISSADAERAREQIEDGLERLVERLEKVNGSKYKRKAKKNKKAWTVASGLVKEAQKATNITGITITVPLLISRIARVCINGMVSAGHDIEDLYARQVKGYGLDKREQAEVMQLLADMGYPLRQDRGMMPGEEVDQSESDNLDWAANYYS